MKRLTIDSNKCLKPLFVFHITEFSAQWATKSLKVHPNVNLFIHSNTAKFSLYRCRRERVPWGLLKNWIISIVYICSHTFSRNQLKILTFRFKVLLLFWKEIDWIDERIESDTKRQRCDKKLVVLISLWLNVCDQNCS